MTFTETPPIIHLLRLQRLRCGTKLVRKHTNVGILGLANNKLGGTADIIIIIINKFPKLLVVFLRNIDDSPSRFTGKFQSSLIPDTTAVANFDHNAFLIAAREHL
jgi:hypothetical protein